MDRLESLPADGMEEKLSHPSQSRRDPSLARGVFLIFLAVGLALLFGSYLVYRSARARLENWVSTSGVVVALKESSKTPGTYAPLVEFASPTGDGCRFLSSVYSAPPAYAKGQQIRVLYNPRDPCQANIDSFATLWFFPLILLGIGITFVLVSGLGVWLSRMGVSERSWQIHWHRKDTI